MAIRLGSAGNINVTPMADIMIVLLIIFMVATPFIHESRVPLPFARNAIERPEAELKVVVTAGGGIAVGDAPLRGVEALREYVQHRIQASGESLAVRVEADRGADYAQVARVLEACRMAGVMEIGLAARTRMD